MLNAVFKFHSLVCNHISKNQDTAHPPCCLISWIHHDQATAACALFLFCSSHLLLSRLLAFSTIDGVAEYAQKRVAVPWRVDRVLSRSLDVRLVVVGAGRLAIVPELHLAETATALHLHGVVLPRVDADKPETRDVDILKGDELMAATPNVSFGVLGWLRTKIEGGSPPSAFKPGGRIVQIDTLPRCNVTAVVVAVIVVQVLVQGTAFAVVDGSPAPPTPLSPAMASDVRATEHLRDAGPAFRTSLVIVLLKHRLVRAVVLGANVVVASGQLLALGTGDSAAGGAGHFCCEGIEQSRREEGRAGRNGTVERIGGVDFVHFQLVLFIFCFWQNSSSDLMMNGEPATLDRHAAHVLQGAEEVTCQAVVAVRLCAFDAWCRVWGSNVIAADCAFSSLIHSSVNSQTFSAMTEWRNREGGGSVQGKARFVMYIPSVCFESVCTVFDRDLWTQLQCFSSGGAGREVEDYIQSGSCTTFWCIDTDSNAGFQLVEDLFDVSTGGCAA